MLVPTLIVLAIMAIVVTGLYLVGKHLTEFEGGFIYFVWGVMILLVGSAIYMTYAVPSFAQTATTQTTVSAAVSATSTTVTLASGTNVAVGSELLIDNEDFIVVSVTGNYSATLPLVLRGQNGTAVWGHNASAIVWVGAPQSLTAPNTPFVDYDAFGTCASTATPFLPIINRRDGLVFGCTNSTWQPYDFTPPIGQTFSRTPIVDTNYTVLLTDYLVAYTTISGWKSVTLPSATGLTGHVIIVKDEQQKLSPFSVTLTIIGSIDGVSNLNMTYDNQTSTSSGGYRITGGAVQLYSNGLAWFTW